MARVIAVIPARGGSTRIPRKNLQEIKGESLVERAIWQALTLHRIGVIDAVVVSTDDPEIAARASKPGVIVLRRVQDGDGAMSVVLAEVVAAFGAEALYVLLQPTSPLRSMACVHKVIRECTRPVVTVRADGKRDGAVYVIQGWELLFSGSDDEIRDPDVLWRNARCVQADNGPDINTPDDLDEARRRVCSAP